MFNLDPKTKKLVKLAGKIFLGIVVASTVAWFLVINPYLIAQEKKRFEAASAELDKLAQQIQAKIGAAQEVKAENFCNRPNLKFAKGPLSCYVTNDLMYTAIDELSANNLTNSLKSISDEPLREGAVFMKGTSFDKNEDRRQFIFQSLPNIYNLSCTNTYSYSSNQTEKNYIVHISCGSSARSEYFPLQD